MRINLRHLLSQRIAWILSISCVVAALNCAGDVTAQLTQAYTFETGLEGFAANGGGVTVSHNTDSNFASEGTGSMKLDYMDFSSFAGGQTAMLHPDINDPPGVEVVVFDFINTNRLVPDNPVAGQDPTFANTSISVFGQFTNNPGVTEHIQYFFSEEPIGTLEPGTHEVVIDVTGGGLLIGSGDIKGFNQWIADGFIPGSFQIYINKSAGFGDPDFAWTVYIDNIRVGQAPAGIPGDFNEDGRVDAADYVRWRSNDSANDPLPNDNGLASQVDRYNLWVANFGEPMLGGGSVSAVPEPMSALLLVIAGAGWYLTKRVRAAL
jgi:hypothetical protein